MVNTCLVVPRKATPYYFTNHGIKYSIIYFITFLLLGLYVVVKRIIIKFNGFNT